MRVNVGNLTLVAAAASGPYLRVMLSGGKAALAGALDSDIGTLNDRVLTADDLCSVVPKNVEGTVKMVAAGAISQYALVYGAAGGKVDDTANANFIGTAMTSASGDGSYIEVLRDVAVLAPGDLAGRVELDDDFLGDYPAAGSAMGAGTNWTKTETNGLGVTASAEANGVLIFAFDAVAEAATAALYKTTKSFDIDKDPIFEARLAVFDIGDDAALDINFGLADGTHATDFDSVSVYAAFHLDGNNLSVNCRSKSSGLTVVDVDSTVDLVDDTYAEFRIDATDKADVKFYINGTRVCSGTTFDVSAYAGLLMPIVHVEKTSNDTTADVRVDRVRVTADRN